MNDAKFSSLHLGLHMSPPNHYVDPLPLGIGAERAGFNSLWIPDGLGRMDAFTLAAGLAPQTEAIQLCLGIVPVFTRPAAVIATSAMTLSHLAPGRVVLGLGASSHTMVEQWYGIPFEKPLTRVRETTELVKQMLAGSKSAYEGETIRSHNFRLGLAPKGNTPIYLAGLRPKMLELAGEHADGVVLNLVPRELLPRILEHIDVGAKRSGRRVEDLNIALYVYTFVTADDATARHEMAAIAAGYFSTPVYNNFLKWMGYEREADQIMEGFRVKSREMTLGAFTEEVLHKLAIIGSAEQCRAEMVEYANAGVSIPVLTPAAADPSAFEETLQAFSRS
jgi:probable F420-dependent oxidoreductase